MLLSAGEHEIGPWNGHLILRTFREGVAARAGHDLVIEATRWQGTITIPDAPDSQPRLAVEVDLRCLQVREGHGGAKPLTDSDRREINKTSAKLLRTGEHPQALFVSTTVRVDGDKATVDGELTLLEVTHPLRLCSGAAPLGWRTSGDADSSPARRSVGELSEPARDLLVTVGRKEWT
jgi:hypothetical protein